VSKSLSNNSEKNRRSLRHLVSRRLVSGRSRQGNGFYRRTRPVLGLSARCPAGRLEDPWVRSPIDAFILKRLREKQLRPSDPLTRIPLIRRVTFDLTGLPPTPEEVDASLHDRSLDAYEKLVDRLLASPSYGERWALSGWMLSVTRILTASNWIRTVPMLGAIAIT
jgi:hypothetical protein